MVCSAHYSRPDDKAHGGIMAKALHARVRIDRQARPDFTVRCI